MGILNNIFKKKSSLIGTWSSDINDKITLDSVGNCKMTFTKNGELIYDIIENNKIQRINMVYFIKEDVIYSNQPSSPKQEKTKFTFYNEYTLILEFEGQSTKFKRII